MFSYEGLGVISAELPTNPIPTFAPYTGSWSSLELPYITKYILSLLSAPATKEDIILSVQHKFSTKFDSYEELTDSVGDSLATLLNTGRIKLVYGKFQASKTIPVVKETSISLLRKGIKEANKNKANNLQSIALFRAKQKYYTTKTK